MQDANRDVLKPRQIVPKTSKWAKDGSYAGVALCLWSVRARSGAGTLLRHDTPVPVGYRGLMLLAALAGRPGEILSKSELMDAAWPGAVVEEGNLTVQIALLAEAARSVCRRR